MSAPDRQPPAGLDPGVRTGKLNRDIPVDLDAVRAGAPHEDLRDWLAMVDALGDLRVLEGVSLDGDVGRITEMLQHTEGAPAVLFDAFPGYPSGYRILVNAQSERRRLAVTLGLPADISVWDLMDEWERRMDTVTPLPVAMVADDPRSAPVTEVTQSGADVNLLQFPVPLWHAGDGGRYIGTGDCVITRDPDSGWVNVGTYRVMIHDAASTGLYISPGKHGRMHRDKAFERNEPLPAVVLAGMDPLLFVASCLEMPPGLNELEWAGGMRGRPIECFAGRSSGLPIPARAEIALEGYASNEQMLPEGPFGEWTGYYGSGERAEPVLHVEALYYRDDPIILGCPPGRPPDELARYRAPLRSALLYEELAKAGVPDVAAVWQHEAGGSRMFTVVSIRQRYPGHARQVLHVASQCHTGAYAGKYVVVVDDDIDPSDLQEVIWAICTRSDPAESIDFIHRAWSTPLDPRLTPEQRAAGDYTNSRALIDATRPWEWRESFPPLNVPPLSQRQAALERWAYLLQ